jgi:hypothetical protein
VFRNSYEDTLVLKLSKYSELHRYFNMGERNDDGNDDASLSTKRSLDNESSEKPSTTRSYNNQYLDLGDQRKRQIKEEIFNIIKIIPQLAKYTMESFSALLRDISNKCSKLARNSSSGIIMDVEVPLLGIELDDGIESEVDPITLSDTKLPGDARAGKDSIKYSKNSLLNIAINKCRERLSSKRNIYDESVKADVLEIFVAYRSYFLSNGTYRNKTLSVLNRIARTKTLENLKDIGYDRITSKDIKRWYNISIRDEKIRVRRGPKVNTTFEAMVWGELIMVIDEDQENIKADNDKAAAASVDENEDPLKDIFKGYKIVINT